MAFITPTNLRLTSGGVVNIDFLTTDNTSRLTSDGVITNGKSFGGGGGGFQAAWAINANKLINCYNQLN